MSCNLYVLEIYRKKKKKKKKKKNPLCSYIIETESTVYLCPFYGNIRKTLLDNINNTIGSMSSLSNDKLIHLLLNCNEAYSVEVNAAILKYTIIFLKSSESFDIALI